MSGSRIKQYQIRATLQCLENDAYTTSHKLALCIVLDTVHNFPLATPHMDQLIGVLRPFVTMTTMKQADTESGLSLLSRSLDIRSVASWLR